MQKISIEKLISKGISMETRDFFLSTFKERFESEIEREKGGLN